MDGEQVDWRGVWTLATGQPPENDYVPPWAASVIFFSINMCAGIGLRTLTSVIVPAPLKNLLIDFLCTMEACAYFFENSYVLKYYGSGWFIAAIVAQCFVCSRTFQGGSENPVKALLQVTSKEISALEGTVKIIVQSLAGLASYRFARMIWSLDMIQDHHERFYETSCSSDLQVALLVGFLIELSASLVDTWLGLQTVANSPLVDELLKYVSIATMVAMGVTTTGMYFNPAMASGHMFGCQGTPAVGHFFVYWAGPFVGGFAGYMLNRLIHIDISTKEKAIQDPKKTE